MTNPSRSITATSPAVLLSLLLSAAAAAPTATAQTSTDSSSLSDSNSSYSNVNPSMAVLIMVLFFAFFLMGFLSFYIRYCNPENSGDSGLATAGRQKRVKPGLDQEVIDSFPIFQYSDVKDLKFGKGGATLECAVCIAEFENDDALRLLPKCDHVFHPECIDAWLASHSTCPVCRANLAPSQEELGQVTESTQSSESDGAQNQNQDETQISVDAEEGGNREARASEFPKRKIPRSHSTGHSLSQPGENLERYTLRLPVELRREMMSRRSGGSLKRTISCVVVLPTSEGSSRRGGGEGSSSRGRSDRWVFSMTPPFLSRARFVASPKVGFEGDLTAVVGSNRSFLANVRAPFDCIAVKSDGGGQTSTRPPV
ncbi:hypothetical protein RHSIM_Rhsim10G0169600 [Rhododendron simsii]|uniref:RING-type E3 ubiquitin transferase n=1 Tax=Rhododendron simsii TaxID=118357 RepID=A0A834G932_RHOSS|nr:hypothetical protein RHSIM_Rhsim10G0169600 [Rhododendron simsii]